MRRYLFCLALMVVVASSLPAQDAPQPPPGGIRLLPGWTHTPKQGFDSIVGVIEKKDGPTIMYEIGRVAKPGGLALGGDFQDRAKGLKEIQRLWYAEQTVAGQPVHLALGKDNAVYVSFPEGGVNFSAIAKTPAELAEVLLIVLSYPTVEKA